jgi:hypothetical protein
MYGQTKGKGLQGLELPPQAMRSMNEIGELSGQDSIDRFDPSACLPRPYEVNKWKITKPL